MRAATIPDAHRYLTCRGRKRFRTVSGVLRKLNINPDHIFSSPKIRAVQTADILAEKLHYPKEVIITPLLEDFSLPSLQELLKLYPLAKECVLVGHDPDFSNIIGNLLNLSTCTVTKGCVVTFNISTNQSTLSADILSHITSGGKHISNKSKAMARLQLGNA